MNGEDTNANRSEAPTPPELNFDAGGQGEGSLSADSASAIPQSSILDPPPPFPLFPGETPRAFSAFMAFFQLGHGRSLQAVADQLDERLGTTKKWSSKYRWSDRIQSYNSGLLRQQAEAETASRQKQAADWARRTAEQRELEWAIAQKLRAAAQCFLESFGDREVARMNLAQVSRALAISSRLARLALSGDASPEEPVMTPLQLELAAALKRAFGQPPAADPCCASDGKLVTTLNS